MTKEEIEKHKIAVQKLELIKNRVFEFIKTNLGKISEWEVQNFILSEFKKEKSKINFGVGVNGGGDFLVE